MSPSPASIAHGPALVGTFLNLILFGIMTVQVFFYFTTYKKDKPGLKLFVATLYVADIVNCVFDMIWIYSVLVDHFADLSALETGNWVFSTDPAMVGIIATMSQMFFAWRVYVLTRNVLLVAFIGITAWASAFGGIGVAIAIRFVPEFIRFQKFSAVVIVWLICAAICDTTITIALTWHLRRHKTGFASTDTIVSKIIRLTIQNGLITALWAIADLAVYLGTPTGLHLAFNFPLAKLYSCTLMSTLCSRGGGGYMSTDPITASSSKNLRAAGRRPEVLHINSMAPKTEVYVGVESHELREVDEMERGAWDHKQLQAESV